MNAPLCNAVVVTAAEDIAASDANPARCEVTGTIERTIGFEVNPPANWNNKLLVVGIGGNAGTITDTSLGWRRNYATATTDTGHKGNGGDTSWALNHPQGEASFAHRAFHLTTVTTKEIIRRFYGTAARKAYFTGCSGGGPGCHQADYLAALEAWVEQGKAPEQIIGKGTNPVRTRPLCAYPTVARYQGSGEVNEAASFRCEETKP